MTESAAVRWVDSHCHLQIDGGDEHVVRGTRRGRRVDGVRRHRPRDVGGGAACSPTGTTTCTRPWDCTRTTRRSSRWSGSLLEPLAVSDACLAIGECGFDLFYEHSPRDEQETAFRFQIRLAKDTGKPLVIHARDAWDDTFRVLDDEGVPDRTIFHCFTGGPAEARARVGARLLPVVQRHRVVQERAGPARRGPHHARRPHPRRDRLAVPHARAVPRAGRTNRRSSSRSAPRWPRHATSSPRRSPR